ncbi:unnamed protein product, partial [Discosporangium mesarthrocarpum]
MWRAIEGIQSGHNSLPLILLLLVHFLYLHSVGMLLFLAGTMVVATLDRRCRAQASQPNRSVALLGLATLAVSLVLCQAEALKYL